jgi:Mn-dependent DtxR family transcriptional regulator
MAHDRTGGASFLTTQDFVANMLGMHHPGVNIAVGMLGKAGLIRHERGRLHMLDREGLENAACECYRIVEEGFAWLDTTAGNGSTAEHAGGKSD